MMKNLIAFAFSAFLLSCAGAPKTEEKSFIDENIDFARAQIGNEIGDRSEWEMLESGDA